MNSFNHYAYGAVFDWIFSVSCGISPVAGAPGYREVELAPRPDRCLGFVQASIETRCGCIRSGSRRACRGNLRGIPSPAHRCVCNSRGCSVHSREDHLRRCKEDVPRPRGAKR